MEDEPIENLPPPPPPADSRPSGFAFAPRNSQPAVLRPSGVNAQPGNIPSPQPSSGSYAPPPPRPKAGEQSPEELREYQELMAREARYDRNKKIAIISGIVLVVLFIFKDVIKESFRHKPWKESPMLSILEPVDNPSEFDRAFFTMWCMMELEEALQPMVLLQGSPGAPPIPTDLKTLVAAGDVEDRARWDGWTQPIVWNPDARSFSSPGTNGKFGDADDIVRVFSSNPLLPDVYWAAPGSFERTTQDSRFDGDLMLRAAQLQIGENAANMERSEMGSDEMESEEVE
jgi:hypothetical protein